MNPTHHEERRIVEDLDKLLRYEAMINRQLNHAMGELDRVQTRREGKADRN